VRGPHGGVVAALSVGGPRNRLTAASVAGVARKLQAAAARMSERLGYRGKSGKVRAS
jgi:DNA-binding IclR family transcriptional regulator